ncbi:hypothetical protein QEN19_000084 [Hanseniaspora menglaensis]
MDDKSQKINNEPEVVTETDSNSSQKRSFSTMTNEDIKSEKIIVSKLIVPTSINEIRKKSNKDFKESPKNFTNDNLNDIDTFYKENVEELNDLISELKSWESKHSELNYIYQDLKRKLNNEIVPEIEIQKNIVIERKKNYDELKLNNDLQIQNFEKKINLMRKTQETEQLRLSQENRKVIDSKEKFYVDERIAIEKKLSDDKRILLQEIETLRNIKNQKLALLNSTDEIHDAKLKLGQEMNSLKSQRFDELHQKASGLELINSELNSELKSIEENIKINLVPMRDELKQKISSATMSLEDIVEKRIKKIEESVHIAKQYEQMQIKYNQLQSQLASFDNKVRSASDSVIFHKEQLQEKEMKRRILHNELQDLRGNIRVFCRIKPDLNPQFNMKEVKKNNGDNYANDEEALSSFERYQLEIQPPVSTKGLITGSPYRHASTTFTFDRIFDEKATNKDVFDEVSQLVQSSLDGYKVCIFAYGQTGSGKTYTMLNNKDGIIPSTLQHIYSWIDNLKPLGWEYSIKIQFIEIYNENIIDLFANKKNSRQNKKKIDIRHMDGKTTLTNVEQIDITHSNDAEDILRNAMKSRATAATKENDQSSRSHSIFTITLKGSNKITNKSCEGVLNLIDLAGSERLNKSQATGDRLKETQAINKSLSCLGDVIHSLNHNKTMKTSHIPFRNSKLTYILQNYLTGDGKTLMFVNVSSTSYVETVNSLRFSSKVNGTKMR